MEQLENPNPWSEKMFASPVLSPAMADIPLDLVVDIIWRLPAKALLRFRQVSKIWKRLIDCSNFVNLHMKKSIDSQVHCHLIIRKNSDLFSVDLDLFDPAVELIHPLMCYGSRINIWGSCNGILCICNVAEDIALWNPSTRKYRILPSLPSERLRDGVLRFAIESYGFGFDSVHDDFKLLKISQFIGLEDPLDFDSHVKVFSMRKFCWMPIESMTYILRYNTKMGVFVNSALHWVVSRNLGMGSADLVVAFDLGTDKFQEIPLPELTDSQCEIHVDVLGGCLCLLANFDRIRFEVWVMKEYGVKESWMKLLTVSQVDFVGSIKSVKPLSYSKTGCKVLLLHNRRKLIWYDLHTQKVHDAVIDGLPHSFDAETLVESLISVDTYRENTVKKILEEKRDDFLSEGFKLVL
ncbi:F-box protein CPR1 [Benincasa hispida]|uniref:F-box protein CPR1 n=1 Tax=Benincasa hispida TaxID=102211 RepID=UPI00190137E9|nr:F-box protein CPR1 [Benincasa hispida]XP_038894349.1 F-box protein CPR1 [Benincasa hispida]